MIFTTDMAHPLLVVAADFAAAVLVAPFVEILVVDAEEVRDFMQNRGANRRRISAVDAHVSTIGR